MKTDIPETAIHASYLPWLARVDALGGCVGSKQSRLVPPRLGRDCRRRKISK